MKRFSSILFYTGVLFSCISLILFFFIYKSVIFSELSYIFSIRGKDVAVVSSDEEKPVKNKIIKPIDEEFGIVIPKINANAKVIKDVSPFNSSEYQLALTKGVAHAKGSVYPGQFGNVFLFSHSSVNFYEAVRYNSVFYLLSKLEKGDDIYIFYKNNKIKYKVFDKKIVDSGDTFYLTNNLKKHTLTVMTCWPPGTTFKRLLVIAEIDD